MKKVLLLSMIVFMFLAGCAKTNNPMDDSVSSDAPDGGAVDNFEPNIANGVRGNAYLDAADLLIMESYPPQFSLHLTGNLPTPCNQLMVDVAPPDSQNKILVDVYSLSDPNKMCAEVLQPFEENIPLGSFPTGHYTIWINGAQTAEFDS